MRNHDKNIEDLKLARESLLERLNLVLNSKSSYSKRFERDYRRILNGTIVETIKE